MKNKKNAVVLLILGVLIGMEISNYEHRNDYEQGHYDALVEARDTYGLEVTLDEYSSAVKGGTTNE